MTQPNPSPLDFRASQSQFVAQTNDEAREHAIRVLTDAYAYDVITDVEFERRLGLMGLDATPAMMNSLVADLTRRGDFVRTPEPSLRAASEGRIVGIMSETRRKGAWHVPQRLRVRAVMSDVKIDLRYAAIPEGCTIDVRAVMANVSLIVPPGMIVSFNIDPFMGSARSDADGGIRPGFAHVHVTGQAIMAEVRVRVRALGRA